MKYFLFVFIYCQILDHKDSFWFMKTIFLIGSELLVGNFSLNLVWSEVWKIIPKLAKIVCSENHKIWSSEKMFFCHSRREIQEFKLFPMLHPKMIFALLSRQAYSNLHCQYSSKSQFAYLWPVIRFEIITFIFRRSWLLSMLSLQFPYDESKLPTNAGVVISV